MFIIFFMETKNTIWYIEKKYLPERYFINKVLEFYLQSVINITNKNNYWVILENLFSRLFENFYKVNEHNFEHNKIDLSYKDIWIQLTVSEKISFKKKSFEFIVDKFRNKKDFYSCSWEKININFKNLWFLELKSEYIKNFVNYNSYDNINLFFNDLFLIDNAFLQIYYKINEIKKNLKKQNYFIPDKEYGIWFNPKLYYENNKKITEWINNKLIWFWIKDYFPIWRITYKKWDNNSIIFLIYRDKNRGSNSLIWKFTFYL